MTPKRLEVWLVRVQVGKSLDARPCIVLAEPRSDGAVAVVALSSAKDLKRPGFDFPLNPDHPNWMASGLRRPSQVLGDGFRLPEFDDFIERWGRLEGDLAREFEVWLG